MGKYEKIIDIITNLYSDQKNINLHEPTFIGNEFKYLSKCIETKYVSSIGSYVDSFEQNIARFVNSKRAVATVNGTSALHIALKTIGVEKNDDVITQGLTFVATANAISYIGANPIFIDVDIDTMGLSPNALENFLNANAELRDGKCFNRISKNIIKACVPMHTFGLPLKIDKIIKICNKWNIKVIEDSAESLGSKYKNKYTGTFGKLGVFSFNGNKIITCGGGGIVVSNNNLLSNRIKFLTTTAKKPHAYEYIHSEIGFNYRMPNINAALGCAQLEKIESLLKNKREIAKYYDDKFEKIGIKFIKEPKDCESNYWLMSIQLENKRDRDIFLNYSNSKGVRTRPIWRLMHRLNMYKKCQRDSQKNAIFLEERVVTLPSSCSVNFKI